MTPRQRAMLYSPPIAVLLLTAAWNLWDRRADIAAWLFPSGQ